MIRQPNPPAQHSALTFPIPSEVGSAGLTQPWEADQGQTSPVATQSFSAHHDPEDVAAAAEPVRAAIVAMTKVLTSADLPL